MAPSNLWTAAIRLEPSEAPTGDSPSVPERTLSIAYVSSRSPDGTRHTAGMDQQIVRCSVPLAQALPRSSPKDLSSSSKSKGLPERHRCTPSNLGNWLPFHSRNREGPLSISRSHADRIPSLDSQDSASPPG